VPEPIAGNNAAAAIKFLPPRPVLGLPETARYQAHSSDAAAVAAAHESFICTIG
jgi:hypothetical protein